MKNRNKIEKSLLNLLKNNSDKEFSFTDLRKEFNLKAKKPKLLIKALQKLQDTNHIKITEYNRYAYNVEYEHVEPQKVSKHILAVYDEISNCYRALTYDISGATMGVLDEDIDKYNVKNNYIVEITPVKKGSSKTLQRARLIKIVAKSIKGHESLISLKSFGLSEKFPQAVIEESESLSEVIPESEKAKREDLRNIALVTIDGEDAKDFDDAVFAERISKGPLAGGFHVVVAIADVAYYVKKGSALEKEALVRGNSTYFPDMVIPMLPEKLSNNLCSLKPNVDRLALAVHLYLDSKGNLKKYRFTRAVINSKRRLTYNEVQNAIESKYSKNLDKNFFDKHISVLEKVFDILKIVREQRNALDLDTIESKIILDDHKNVLGIVPIPRLKAHMIIEELMILANVAAAKVLSKSSSIYRIHEEPNEEKIDTLKKNLSSLHIKSKISEKRSGLKEFSKLISRVKTRPDSDIIMGIILRSQSQAKYSSENLGHFGLALTHYTHFTSPIRRFSDLIVHRLLIDRLKLASHGGFNYSEKKINGISEQINKTERLSQKAEWSSQERFIAEFYSDKIGSPINVEITSVNSFGLFARVDNSSVEGLIPLREMTNDYYIYNQDNNTLRGRRTRKTVKIGTRMKVKIASTNPIFGKISFSFVRFL